jgi:hypothetical protein
LATFNVPKEDRFQIISEYAPGTEIMRPPSYLGIEYSDDLTVIQITCNDTRSLDQKKALFAAIAVLAIDRDRPCRAPSNFGPASNISPCDARLADFSMTRSCRPNPRWQRHLKKQSRRRPEISDCFYSS